MNDSRHAFQRFRQRWARARVVTGGIDGELTLYGTEKQEQMSSTTVIDSVLMSEHRRQIRSRLVSGLGFLLTAIILLAVLVVAVVAAGLVTEGFAVYILGVTVPSILAAWTYLIRRAFPR
jgi:hypothetical protein